MPDADAQLYDGVANAIRDDLPGQLATLGTHGLGAGGAPLPHLLKYHNDRNSARTPHSAISSPYTNSIWPTPPVWPYSRQQIMQTPSVSGAPTVKRLALA